MLWRDFIDVKGDAQNGRPAPPFRTVLHRESTFDHHAPAVGVPTLVTLTYTSGGLAAPLQVNTKRVSNAELIAVMLFNTPTQLDTPLPAYSHAVLNA